MFLTVSPDASVANVIDKMSAVRSSDRKSSTDKTSTQKRASCIIVLDQEVVVGICTERDIVRLTATKLALMKPLADISICSIMTSPVKTMEASAFKDIFAVLFLFRRYRIRHLPIVDGQQKLLGVVTPASIRSVMRPANLLKMRRVSDVMSRDVVQAPITASIIVLAQKMAQYSVSCVVIVEPSVSLEDESKDELKVDLPVGIVTERDIVQFQALALNLQKVTAGEVMSTPLFLLNPKDSLWAAHEAMQARRVRRLVVSWNRGQGLGIVTQTSLLRVFDPIEMCRVIDSLQETIAQMETEEARVKAMGAAASLEAQIKLAEDAIASIAHRPDLDDGQRQQLRQAIELVKQIKA